MFWRFPTADRRSVVGTRFLGSLVAKAGLPREALAWLPTALISPRTATQAVGQQVVGLPPRRPRLCAIRRLSGI